MRWRRSSGFGFVGPERNRAAHEHHRILPAVERAHHQEVSDLPAHRQEQYAGRILLGQHADPVLTGVGEMIPGEMAAESGEVLPDVYSGTFSYQGNDFATRGMRVVLQRKLLLRSDRNPRLCLRRRARPVASRRPTAGRAGVDSRGAAPGCGREIQRNFAQGEDALDRLLSLHRRPHA